MSTEQEEVLITCPHCKQEFEKKEVFIDVVYRGDGVDKIACCPHCLKDL